MRYGRVMRPRVRDRGALLTRWLFGLGLGLLGIVVAVLLVRGTPERQPPTSAAATTAQRTAPPVSAPATTAQTVEQPSTSTVQNGIAISDVRVTATTPFSVTVAWRTQPASRGRLAVGPAGSAPTLWSAADGPAADHQATVGGLSLDSSYAVEVGATADGGRHAQLVLPVRTPLAPTTIVAATAGGAITLDGQPFFPLMVWGECPAAYGQILAAGIDLLAENPCSGTNAQVDALAGHALAAGIAGDAEAQNPAVIGWFYPDEADARQITARTLPAVPPTSVVGRVSFLTLSNHFYSRAAPLPFGRGMYRGLVAKADVVGFDLYPLQIWCNPAALDDVYDSQRELVRLAAGKPTFQWIEAGGMGCARADAAVTPATVRAESWLAVAGGAHGLGFFPGEWSPAIGAAVTSVSQTVKAVAPALLAPETAVEAPSPLKAVAHTLNDAVYVVVVNPTRGTVRAEVRVPALGTRTLRVLGGQGGASARDGVFSGRFGPLAARVYVAAPPS